MLGEGLPLVDVHRTDILPPDIVSPVCDTSVLSGFKSRYKRAVAGLGLGEAAKVAPG